MAITTKYIPKTAAFVEESNPLQRIIQYDLINKDGVLETFTLRTILLDPPIVFTTQDLLNIQITDPVQKDYNDFVLVFKSMTMAPYTTAQVYATPLLFELLNAQGIQNITSFAFEELQ